MAKAMAVKIEVDGLKPLLKRLKKLPDKIRLRPVRAAANYAMTPILKDARRRVPLGEGLRPTGQERPHLRDTLIKKVKTYRSSGTIVAIVGHDYRKTPHAHLVHFGTRPHTIAGNPRLAIGGVVIGGAIRHPGARAQPYLTDALRANESKVQKRFREKLARDIEKQIKRLRAKK